MNNSEKIHKLKISYYQIGIVVCPLICTGVYIWSILSASEYSVYFEPGIGFYYLYKYLYLTVPGRLECIFGQAEAESTGNTFGRPHSRS